MNSCVVPCGSNCSEGCAGNGEDMYIVSKEHKIQDGNTYRDPADVKLEST